jgi:hypothetical protein
MFNELEKSLVKVKCSGRELWSLKVKCLLMDFPMDSMMDWTMELVMAKALVLGCSHRAVEKVIGEIAKGTA